MSFLIWDISVLILAFKGEALSKGSEVTFSFLAWFPKEMRVMPLLSVCPYFSLILPYRNFWACQSISARIKKHCKPQEQIHACKTSWTLLVGEQKEMQIRALAEQRWGKRSWCHLLGSSRWPNQDRPLIGTRLSLDKPGQKRLLGWRGCNSETRLLPRVGGSQEHRAPLPHRHVSSSALHSCSYNSVIKFCLPCQNSQDVLQITHGNTISGLERLQFRDINYINS